MGRIIVENRPVSGENRREEILTGFSFERAEIVFWPLFLQIVFPILLYLGREELGIKGILIFVGIWAALCVVLPALGLAPYFFKIAAQVLIDVILIVVVFGGDIKIW